MGYIYDHRRFDQWLINHLNISEFNMICLGLCLQPPKNCCWDVGSLEIIQETSCFHILETCFHHLLRGPYDGYWWVSRPKIICHLIVVSIRRIWKMRSIIINHPQFRARKEVTIIPDSRNHNFNMVYHYECSFHHGKTLSKAQTSWFLSYANIKHHIFWNIIWSIYMISRQYITNLS